MTLRTWTFGDVRVSDSGEIDSNAIIAFTRGHCHSLAIALSELTGWPVYGIPDHDFGGMAHVVVKSPRGFIDIEGLGVTKRWKERGFGHPVPVNVDDALNQSTPFDRYMKPEPDKAMPFARTLLHKYFPERYQ